MKINDVFLKRVKLYFKDNSNEYIKLLDKPCTQGFFLNTNKASKQEILDMIDFDYSSSYLTDCSYYHNCENIGKTKAYELGLIYPQEIAASISSLYINTNNIKTVVDMCCAPGGKSINIMNKLNNNTLFICNDFDYRRACVLSSNLERLGLDNCIVTNKNTKDLSKQLENFADLVILDAPCSGEGMIRKYPEIMDDYSLDNIINLAKLQSELLEDAYKILKCGGQLLYSTCTYAFEEDEYQVNEFLKKHSDMQLVNLNSKHSSYLEECIKLSPIDNTEGQFICLMQKSANTNNKCYVKELKTIKNKIVDDFIKENINIDNYYLYKNNEHYYLSLMPLIDMKNNVLRYGIYIGDIKNNRFEPTHNLYRSNSLRKYFKYTYDLNEEEYKKYISGNELDVKLDNNYYLITYNNHSIGYGKCSNNKLKNKYPKGLRQML